FMFLLTIALGASCWSFVSESRLVMSRLMGQKAMELSSTLAMASEKPMAEEDFVELSRIGKRLTNNGDIITVGFMDTNGRSIGCAGQEQLRSTPTPMLPDVRTITAELMQVHHRYSAAFGSYVQVVAPVMGGNRYAGAAHPAGSRLLGYVMVCIV